MAKKTVKTTTEENEIIIDTRIDELESELSIAEIKLIDLRESADRFRAEAARLQTEFDNFRRRNIDAVVRARQEGALEAAGEFLGVVDTADWAAGVIKDPEVKKGVEMIAKSVTGIFDKLGIAEINAAGQPFDPGLHDALGTAPVDNPELDGLVAAVIKKGFVTLEGKVLRHAQVIVGTRG